MQKHFCPRTGTRVHTHAHTHTRTHVRTYIYICTHTNRHARTDTQITLFVLCARVFLHCSATFRCQGSSTHKQFVGMHKQAHAHALMIIPVRLALAVLLCPLFQRSWSIPAISRNQSGRQVRPFAGQANTCVRVCTYEYATYLGLAKTVFIQRI